MKSMGSRSFHRTRPCRAARVSKRSHAAIIAPFLAVVALTWSVAASAGELRLGAVEHGQPVWARFEVRGADGQTYQPEGAIADRRFRPREGNEPWYGGSFVAGKPVTIALDSGRYTVVAERGTEFKRFEESVEVADRDPTELSIEIDRWTDMRAKGWYSGDFHVHRTIEATPALQQAEDLNLAVVFTMWNKRDLWPAGRLPQETVRRTSPGRWMTVLNAEDERGGGAWMFHGLFERLPLAAGARWFPIGIDLIEQARAQKRPAWVEVEKPFWWEAPVVMALAPPDSIGMIHNHFNQYGALANSAWGRPPDERWPEGSEGFLEYSLSLNYRFWNLGFSMPVTAGSASGVLPNPVGYNRVYVKLDEPFSEDGFYRELRSGRSFVTNGPMLFFDARTEGRQIHLSLDAEARAPLEKVEIIANGIVVRTIPVALGETSILTELTVPAGNYSWIAARVYERNDSTVRLAHSQPVWLEGDWAAADDAAFFVGWIDELIEITNKEAERFEEPQQREQVLEQYQKARSFYQQKR